MLIKAHAPVLNSKRNAYFASLVYCLSWVLNTDLGPSINGLVTDGKTKLCSRGFILALFQSTTANKIDSEHTQDYKRLLPVWEAEILRVTIKIIEIFSNLLMLISDGFRLKVPKIAKKGT